MSDSRPAGVADPRHQVGEVVTVFPHDTHDARGTAIENAAVVYNVFYHEVYNCWTYKLGKTTPEGVTQFHHRVEQDLRYPAFQIGQKVRLLLSGEYSNGGFVVGYTIDNEGRLKYQTIWGQPYDMPKNLIATF